MDKKYIVRLTADQRATLEQRTRTGTAAVSVQRHVGAAPRVYSTQSRHGGRWLGLG
jgi:hypothetical protein